MGEIELHIHSEGHEPHEITAPSDIETGEFIHELVVGLRLPEDVIWEADNKDTGRTLAAGKTLHENGVRSGHHLYLKKSRSGDWRPEPPPDRVPPEPPPPDRRSSRLPLVLVIALIPLVAAAAYFLGTGQNQTVRANMPDVQVAVAAANQRASTAEAQVAQLQQQLDDEQQKEGGVNSRVSQLNQQVSQLNQELDRRQKQIKLDQSKISDLTQNANDLHATATANAAKDQDQIKRLEASTQASAQQIATLQSELAAKEQALNVLQRLGKDKQPPPLSRPNYGWLTWSGDLPKGNVIEIRDNRAIVGLLIGKLPGVACTIEAADPENVSIEAFPDAGTGWTRVVFRVKNKNKLPARLLWVVR